MNTSDQETALSLLDTTANMLRGMTMDPAIPKHAKDAMRSRIGTLEAFVEHALDEGNVEGAQLPEPPQGASGLPHEALRSDEKENSGVGVRVGATPEPLTDFESWFGRFPPNEDRKIADYQRHAAKLAWDAALSLRAPEPPIGDNTETPRAEQLIERMENAGYPLEHWEKHALRCALFPAMADVAPRSSEDWRRLSGLWRHGVTVLPPTCDDFYAWLAVLDAAIDEKESR